MKLQLGPEIIDSYKRLSYRPWFALAEFVDNSTQAYFNNKQILDKVFKKDGETLTVEIEYGNENGEEYLRIKDNSIGMSRKELENAVIIGKRPRNISGRSKYGLGLKTAACWFGDFWTVITKKLGDDTQHYIEVNVPKIADNKLDLNHKEKKVKSRDEHYTIITIKKLHRQFAGKTVGKIKNYLRSMYRRDIYEYNFKLCWQKELLTWDYDEQIYSRLIINKNGKPTKRDFKFTINGKQVRGWAGVLDQGSRAYAGFSIIQANRVIIGWPDSYRPETLFGRQEGGSNDLINQRLVGEIFLEGFDVSHTKDEILFSEDESEELDAKLFEEYADFKQQALSYRKYKADERADSEVNCDAALNDFEKELSSNEIKNILFELEIPSVKLIKESNKAVKEAVMKKIQPSLKVKINELKVWLYIVGDMSPNDPYVIIESTESKERVIVIVNKAHPYWVHLNNIETILNFLRHCTYDGVAEWKAYFRTGKLDPDTIKLIKDNLLRLPFEIEKHSV